MGTVWYSARRDSRGKGFITRYSRDRGHLSARPYTSSMGRRFGYEWGNAGLGAMALAIDMLADVQHGATPIDSPAWLHFKEDVIERLPVEGWTITDEAVWDWYLGGVTIESLNDAAIAFLEKGVR